MKVENPFSKILARPLPLAALLGAVFFASWTQADIIRCSFTDPLWDFTYSTTTNKLTLTVSGEGPGGTNLVEVKKDISFQIKGPGEFELWAADRTVLAKLKLNWKGANGASDHIFPYEVEYLGSRFNKLIGGCSSNFLRAYLPPSGKQ